MLSATTSSRGTFGATGWTGSRPIPCIRILLELDSRRMHERQSGDRPVHCDACSDSHPRIADQLIVMQKGEKKGYRGSLALSAMKRGYGGSHAPTKVAPAKVAPGQRREATGAIAVAPKPSPKAGYCRRCCWRKLLSRATFDDPTFVGYCGSPVLAVRYDAW